MLTRRVILQTTLAISNMPGPTEPITFSGNPIVQMFPAVTRIPQVNVNPKKFWFRVPHVVYTGVNNLRSTKYMDVPVQST